MHGDERKTAKLTRGAMFPILHSIYADSAIGHMSINGELRIAARCYAQDILNSRTRTQSHLYGGRAFNRPHSPLDSYTAVMLARTFLQSIGPLPRRTRMPPGTV